MIGRGRSIVLIGFMGAGKSSVGRWLARLTGQPRFDTDEMIENDLGMPIVRIFAEHGETAFRDAETEALRRLPGGLSAVVVTGGGIVLRSENVKLLKSLGDVVYLHADEATILERVVRGPTRPLLQTKDPRATVKKLLRERVPIYREAADFVLSTSPFTPREIATAIMGKTETWRSR